MKLHKNKSIVLTLVFSLVTFFSGIHLWGGLPAANAAALTSVKATLSTSIPDSDADWILQFVTPTGVVQDQTIIINIDINTGTADEFNLSSVAEDDIDIEEDTDGTPTNCAGTLTDEETAGSASATEWGVAINTSTDTITLTAPSNSATYVAAGSCVLVKIGTNATHDGTGANQINNPSKTAAAGTADINGVEISGTFGDTGTALVATVEGVTVSVTVDESLSAVIAEVADASCSSNIVGTDQSDASGHTDTAIAFGTLSAGNTFNHSCHQLTISTNASSGYSTTVEKSQLLTSGANTIADGDCNSGSCSTSQSGVWTTTSENGFGYCMDDVTGDAAATADGTEWTSNQQCDDATPEYKLFGTANSNAQAIMSSAAAVSGDNSIIGVVLNYPGSQAAGTYTTTLTFITTPSF